MLFHDFVSLTWAMVLFNLMGIYILLYSPSLDPSQKSNIYHGMGPGLVYPKASFWASCTLINTKKKKKKGIAAFFY